MAQAKQLTVKRSIILDVLLTLWLLEPLSKYLGPSWVVVGCNKWQKEDVWIRATIAIFNTILL